LGRDAKPSLMTLGQWAWAINRGQQVRRSACGLLPYASVLQFALVYAPNRVIAITSPAPSDGKSFLSANLAALLAESGKRVLLIDADLRRGRLAQYLGRSSQGGLTELLTGQLDFEMAARETGVHGLHFIGSGAHPPNPSEILTSARFA
jgi:tyrosine-protein kinase Etk/Wzc